QMHVRTVSTLVGFNVLPSHFPDFVTVGFRKRLAALFTSHGDGASPRRWQFNVRRLGFAVVQRELAGVGFDTREEFGISRLTVLETLDRSDEIVGIRRQPADLVVSILIGPCCPDET